MSGGQAASIKTTLATEWFFIGEEDMKFLSTLMLLLVLTVGFADAADKGAYFTDSKNIHFDDINRLIDEWLNLMKSNYGNETIQLSERIFNGLMLRLEEDRTKVAIALLRMYQRADVESSEFITWKLENIFYFHPASMLEALNNIDQHLLDEYKNDRFVDYLIRSSCGIPPEITEDPHFNSERLVADANRIISEIQSMDIRDDLKSKVLRILEAWKREAN